MTRWAGVCITTVIDHTGPIPGAVSMLSHWMPPGTIRPRPPRTPCPVSSSQTSECVRITIKLNKMTQGCHVLRSGLWPRNMHFFNKHPVTEMQMSKDHSSLSKWDHSGAPAPLWTLGISQSINTSRAHHPQSVSTMKAHPVMPPPQNTSVLLRPPPPPLFPPLTKLPSVPLEAPTA